MATTFHQIQYWTWVIAPGNSLWLSYGPSDKFKSGTVQVMCFPSPVVADSPTSEERTQTLYVPIVYNAMPPTFVGDETHCYAGFNIFNGGQYAVRYFSVALTIIGP
jgi:hypothetical protein